jgi:hypothetical protein
MLRNKNVYCTVSEVNVSILTLSRPQVGRSMHYIFVQSAVYE